MEIITQLAHRSLRDKVRRIEIGAERIAIQTTRDTIEVPVCLKTRGGEKLLVAPRCEHHERTPRIDPTLVKALARAWIWRRALERGSARSVMDLASQAGHTERYVTRLLRLAYLAPDIIDAILEGSQPLSLTLERLRTIDIPVD